jgi:hypothetical protein
MSTRLAGKGVVDAKPPRDDPAPLDVRLDELRELIEQARELRNQAVAWRNDFQEAVERLRQHLPALRQAQNERKRQ